MAIKPYALKIGLVLIDLPCADLQLRAVPIKASKLRLYLLKRQVAGDRYGREDQL